MKKTFRIGLLLSCLALLFAVWSRSRPKTAEQIPVPRFVENAQIGRPEELRLLAFGDWGVLTKERQAVADAMAHYMIANPADAALLLGDNFYVRIKDTEDPLIQTLFERTYDLKRFYFPFYCALGNHDYSTGNGAIEFAYPRRHPESRWRFPAQWYRLDFPSPANPLATILMLDSNKQSLSDADWRTQIAWIKSELSKPRGLWTICCAHHTLFSNGAHSDNGVLQTEWGSIFKDQHVDFYVCGHDHTLQHLEIPDWPMSFVISGGGAAKLRPMLRDDRGPFSCAKTGFTYLRLTPESADVRMLDARENLLHQFTRDRHGTIAILANTPSQKATVHKLRVIQGIDATTAPATLPSGAGD